MSGLRLHLFVFLTTILLVIGMVLATLFVYDPLQLFTAKRLQWHKDMRLQFAGVINNYSDTYDSLITGTSMFENASADEASTLLNQRFINVSASAADFYERHIMLSSALSSHPVKSVIYSFDRVYLNQNKGFPNPPVVEGFPVYPTESFDFLYDANRLNDFSVYFQPSWLSCTLKWSAHNRCLGEADRLDRPNAWAEQPFQRDKFGGLENWAKFKHDPQVSSDIDRIHQTAQLQRTDTPSKAQQNAAFLRAKSYVDDYFLSLVRDYPKTQFYAVFPPYSRARFAILHRATPIDAHAHYRTLRYLVEATKQHKNLHVFAYEDHDFLDDIANYKDLEHFHQRFNTLIHQDIAAHHTLTPERLDVYLHTATTKAKQYDLSTLSNKIKQALNH